MAKRKHTPGPWHTDPECGNQIVDGPTGRRIAYCAITSLRGRQASEEELRANATLCAAACDLLEALEMVQKRWDRRLSAQDWKTIEDAIAKATGGANG